MPSNSEHSKLISRKMLFGNPDHLFVRLSPNGQYISFIAPKNGVLNVWVAPRERIQDARPVTNDSDRGIRSYFWAYTNKHIVYIQDRQGNEDWHLYCIELETELTRDLTPTHGVQARVLEVSERYPEEMLIAVNDRDPAYHDVYRMNIMNGKGELLFENTQFSGFVADANLSLRFAIRQRPDGGNQILQRAHNDWILWTETEPEDSMTSNPIGFNKTDDVLYMVDSRGRNTAALLAFDLNKEKSQVLFEHPKADVNDILVHPIEKTIQGASATYERKEWTFLDNSIAQDLTYLKSIEHGDVEITTRTLNDDFWIAAFLIDNGPIKYYLYDRKAIKATYLFSSNKALEDESLVKMHSVVIKARDGLELVCYYSLPHEVDLEGTGKASKPVPMVLDVHGGPWARDTWGYDGTHQWLTNRGYAVLNVNFRGSTGLGKDLTNAGDGEWGAKMHDDLMDAVSWAIKQGIADPSKIAIIGASYGGYAVLNALAKNSDTFACGVDIVGPSNLMTLIQSIPPYWRPILDMFKIRLGGDPDTMEGRKFLSDRSPLTHVDKIRKPLLIGQGANDPRVKQAESDQIVHAMQEKRISHTYVLFPDEGHGFVKPENRMGFFAIAEAFLAQNLGGRCESLEDDLQDSSHQIVSDSYDLLETYAA